MLEVQVLGDIRVFYASEQHFSVVCNAVHFSSVHLEHVSSAQGQTTTYRDLLKRGHSVGSTVRSKRGKARWLSKPTFNASRTIHGGLKQSVGTSFSSISVSTLKSLSPAPSQAHLTPGSHRAASSPPQTCHVLCTFRFMIRLSSFMQPYFELLLLWGKGFQNSLGGS